MTVIHLGFGSNLGDRLAHFGRAIRELEAEGIQIERCSSIYETEPVGVSPQPLFLNGVIRGRTRQSPEALLTLIKRIEHRAGRLPSAPGTARPLDLDILLYGRSVVRSASLIVPHPRLPERRFVLVPLAEISPDTRHPVLKLTLRELARACPDPHSVNFYCNWPALPV